MEVSASAFYSWLKTPEDSEKAQRKAALEAKAPNQVCTTDIAYIWTLEGWLYLAVVVDLFSRQVVGWAVADHMRTALCASALQMAF